MVASVISSIMASHAAVGAAIAGCVIMTLIMVLSDDRRIPVLASFNRRVTAFAIPLLIVFVYLVIFWGARILGF